MKFIGFSNQYYTLWEVSTTTKTSGSQKYIITNYNYIKNISTDRNKTFTLYPDVQFDENLKGKSYSFSSTHTEWTDVDTYRFGKYQGNKITNDDLSYLEWYWDQISGEHKDFVSKILVDNGYVIASKTYMGCDGEEHTMQLLISPEEIVVEKQLQAKAKEIQELGEYEVTLEKNLSAEGEYYTDDVTFVFKDFVIRTYNGWEYGLPTINGKAKRVKGKTIKITDYETSSNGFNIKIDVKAFEIL